MKIQVLSDLHIEFAQFEPPQTEADVVVLAGDIGTKLGGLKFAQVAFGSKPVVYVAGNHEYYGSSLPHLTDKLRDDAKGSQVSFLEMDQVVIDYVRILGCSLWTDFDLFGRDNREECRVRAEIQMSDFRRIRVSPEFKKLKPYVTSAIHFKSKNWLEEQLSIPFEGKTMVVTHHAPSMKSIAAQYEDDLLTAAFASHLDEWMTGRGVDLWIHGHTHHCVDYRIGETRVVSNQRGYPGEDVPNFDAACVVTV